jgi:chemotaxis protein methyltransferase CheR
LEANYGIHLKEQKKSLVMGRLQNELIQNGHRSFTEYFDYIMSDTSGNAAETLINRITTNHTYFMRESSHFDYFKNTVLPYLEKKAVRNDLRIWSAGCSTGEEPYTLAMIIDEFFGDRKGDWDTKILATDISGRVLETARKGVYSIQAAASLPKLWKAKYFNVFDKENLIVNERIRNEVIFRKFNLMEHNFPFVKKFHVIFCRNVMIYFDIKTKTELVNKFYDIMEYGGYLFIGHSETLNRDETKYRYILPAVYRKE